MPNNHKTKRCRGNKYKLKVNGIKVNFKKSMADLRDRWNWKPKFLPSPVDSELTTEKILKVFKEMNK